MKYWEIIPWYIQAIPNIAIQLQSMVFEEVLKKFEANQQMFAVLIDPDKYDENSLLDLSEVAGKGGVNFFLVGGSLMTSDRLDQTIQILKSTSNIPIIIFPGSNLQVNSKADALLFLSLISGRNPEFLIGQHVVAAPYVKKSGLETIPTGYMLIEGERQTTANYMSNTFPIPRNKAEIAVCTAMAGEMLGLKVIYMDGGSGALGTIPGEMIKKVKSNISIPLIVGGGITTAKQAHYIWESGADLIVVGNAIEGNLELIGQISSALKTAV